MQTPDLPRESLLDSLLAYDGAALDLKATIALFRFLDLLPAVYAVLPDHYRRDRQRLARANLLPRTDK